MLTLKLKIKNQIDIFEYCKEFQSCKRFAYNRFVDGLTELNIRQLIKSKNLFSKNIDLWFIDCAIKEAKNQFDANTEKETIIFGGKKNFKLLKEGKITKEEWKKLRSKSISSIGEANQKGNRKFKLDIKNNLIIFKPKRGIKIPIEINPKKNYRRQLNLIESLANQKKIPFTVWLSHESISISIDEIIFKKEKEPKFNSKRVIGLDLNPNYIGLSILEFAENDTKFEVLYSEVVDFKLLNVNLGLKSSDPKKIKQNNKRDFENFEVSKHIIELAKHWRVQKIVIEELEIESKDHKKGKNFNRLVNNNWNRTKFIQNLQKRCNINEIKFLEVNPKYSSFVGNILYGHKYPDMIASSIEIARRGYHKFWRHWFYPNFKLFLASLNPWKKEVEQNCCDWKKFYVSLVKISGKSYRSSLEKFINSSNVLRSNNIKSNVVFYCFS